MAAKLIVGLGNPEPQFAWTRHNAGFHVLSSLAAIDVFASIETADCAVITIASAEVVLARPVTGMNSTGKAVKALLQSWSFSPSDLLIVQDDVSLPMGRMRFQHGGGAGGHHGIESTIQELNGESGFDRLKLGVGPDVRGDLRAQFLLGPIADDVTELYNQSVATAADAVKHWVESGVQSAMSRFNGVNLAKRS
ncbi:MAG TPA: aminoacyl-tRNA hydrolase [Planktothrix sp.]|jgi:PTH1 family peptidyl-tRNA hydrolase